MDFEKKDADLQKAIISALVERHTINLNKETGIAYLQAEFEDKVNPCVTLTRDEIRKETGRQKVRDAVMDDYAKALRAPGIEVSRADDDTIQICMTPVRARKNEFGSLSELRTKNESDLEEQPELGDPPCY
ncbi:hypothetical protein [Paraburkholderia dipogonis]|uniref:hypothetical protein n=1 Tax=Paraburkholderia dipogonis TaxID=1211383 RepID=UPI0038BD5AAE